MARLQWLLLFQKPQRVRMHGMNGRTVALKPVIKGEQTVHGKASLLPLEASFSSLGFATFPLIDPSLDV